MIVEIITSRGMSLYIDGEKPFLPNWGFSAEAGVLGTVFVPNEPLRIGPHRVKSVEMDTTESEMWDGVKDPRHLFLKTEDGSYHGPVVVVISGDPDTGPAKVVMENGQRREVDEVTIYIRAELERS